MTSGENGSHAQATAGAGESQEPPQSTVSLAEVPAPPISTSRNGDEKPRGRGADDSSRRKEKTAQAKRAKKAQVRRRRRTRQDQALVHLIGGMTITETALTLKVSRSTVHRWLDDPLFRSRYESLRDDLVDCRFDQQLQASFMATSRLVELMDSEDERVAVRAAIALQVAGQRIYYFVDLTKRIERVENNLMLLPHPRR